MTSSCKLEVTTRALLMRDPWHCGWPPKKPKMPTSPWANDDENYEDDETYEHWSEEHNVYYDEDDEGWWNSYDTYYEDGEWVQDVECDANDYFQNYMDGDYWRWAEYYGEPTPDPQASSGADENPSNGEQTNEEFYGGKGKGKSKNDGCFCLWLKVASSC